MDLEKLAKVVEILVECTLDESGQLVRDAITEITDLRARLAKMEADYAIMSEAADQVVRERDEARSQAAAAEQALKAGRVVVPELTEEDLSNKAGESLWKFIGFPRVTVDAAAIRDRARDQFRAGYDFAVSRVRAVSPSDILQPGQVAVEWIACEDRLPEDGQSVAFISKCDRDEFYRGRILGGRYVAGEFGGFTVPGLMTDASHWFPMPPVPDALRSQGEAGR